MKLKSLLFTVAGMARRAVPAPPRRGIARGSRFTTTWSRPLGAEGDVAARYPYRLPAVFFGTVLLLAVLPGTLTAGAIEDHVFVYRQGQAEWASSGDFNGDGLLDAVIVDRVTGAYRIGYQSAGGEHTWTMARASGIADISGVTVGYLLNGAAHGLAFTAEAANRVNVVPAISPTQAGVPVPVFLPSVGPNQVIALNIGGAGDTALQDLIVPTSWNGVAPYRTTTIRNTDGASFTTLQDLAATQRQDRGNRVVIKDGTAAVLAILARGPTDTLRLVSYAGGPPNTFLEIPNIAGGSDYAVGRFAGTGLRHFLTFRPGRSNLWAHAVMEPVPGTFEVGPAIGYAFNDGIESVVTLPGPTGTKILLIFDQGARAAAYNFDGTNAPTLVGEFPAPEGEILIGATPLENHGIRLHSSGTGKTMAAEVLAHDLGRTSRSHQYSFNAGTGAYSLVRTDTLPRVTDLSGQANVFQFQTEPFVSPTPTLLNSGNAGDWSSFFALAGGPPQVGVLRENFIDSPRGLDNPTATSLGNSHPLTQFGLVNQYADAISLFSLAPGLGNQVVEVSAQPPGGLYGRSVAVSFILGSPAFQVLYRLNPSGAWQTYAGDPVPIFTNSVLQYRARAIFGTAQTSIRSETYTFKKGPNELDSDSDGVPDYVEIANGLNPVSGSDTDEDGFSDFEELLKGTLPADEASQPLTQGYEQHATVDLVLTPRPLNGITGTETFSREGPHVRVFDLSGSQLGAAPVSASPGSSALVTNIFIDPQHKLLVAATEQHFDVQALALDPRIGRELIRLIPAPEVSPIEVNYQFGGAAGVLNAEALNWVVAAQAAYLGATNEIRFHSMTIADTTVAALLEEKLRLALAEAAPTNDNLTLYSFRPRDAGRSSLGDDTREFLEHVDAARPAYDFKQLFHSLEAMVIAAPQPPVQSLNAVAREIYRVSSVSNNNTPGQFQLPLDVLREFIRDGTINSNYLAAGSFLDPVVADAAAGVQFVLNNLGSRPVTNLSLRVRPDTFSGICTVLETDDLSATPVNLFAAGGGAFDFPDTFNLLPGSVVQVVGRPDVSSTTCAGLNVEVLDISLAAIPARSDGDADGNLLIDSWEKQFLGMLGSDPFGDFDDDGYSNLQEMFDGTDPRDGQGVPAGPIAALNLPVLIIQTSAEGHVTLAWNWPEAYMNKVEFQILSTPALDVAATPRALSPIHLGGGIFSAVIPNPGTPAHFFKIVLQLRF